MLSCIGAALRKVPVSLFEVGCLVWQSTFAYTQLIGNGQRASCDKLTLWEGKQEKKKVEVMPFLTPVRPFHGSSLPTCRGEVFRESLVVFGALILDLFEFKSVFVFLLG